MKNRSELREIIIKVLYQIYIWEDTKTEYDITSLIKEQLEIENKFVNDVVLGVVSKQQDINEVADKYLVEWSIERLSKVDKAIISMAIYELLYTDTPSIVVINEAIEVSKKYSDEKVTSMINGVLDNIYHSETSDER